MLRTKGLGFFLILLLAPLLPAAEIDERIKRVESGLLLLDSKQPRKAKLADRMQHHNTPGVSVAVIHEGKIEWSRGYGVLEAGGLAPVTAGALFQAASISKPVAAMAALRMVQEGRLDLDEDVNRRLKSWKAPENEFTQEEKVTLRRILSHSAGLTVHGFRGYAAGEEVPTLVQLLDGRPPANSRPVRVDVIPGMKSSYSGGGFSVMQLLMMDIAGRRFPEIMRETVLEKLGMRHSTYEQPLPRGLRSSAAAGHRANGEVVRGKWHTYPEMAAAGLWTTPSDLARFAIELRKSYAGESGKILSKEMARRMLRRQKGDRGLGVVITGEGAAARFSHGGGNEGYRCYLAACVETGDGAVVMTNSDRGDGLMMEIIRGIAAEYGWPD